MLFIADAQPLIVGANAKLYGTKSVPCPWHRQNQYSVIDWHPRSIFCICGNYFCDLTISMRSSSLCCSFCSPIWRYWLMNSMEQNTVHAKQATLERGLVGVGILTRRLEKPDDMIRSDPSDYMRIGSYPNKEVMRIRFEYIYFLWSADIRSIKYFLYIKYTNLSYFSFLYLCPLSK